MAPEALTRRDAALNWPSRYALHQLRARPTALSLPTTHTLATRHHTAMAQSRRTGVRQSLR
jgi:hypothetical protein